MEFSLSDYCSEMLLKVRFYNSYASALTVILKQEVQYKVRKDEKLRKKL